MRVLRGLRVQNIITIICASISMDGVGQWKFSDQWTPQLSHQTMGIGPKAIHFQHCSALFDSIFTPSPLNCQRTSATQFSCLLCAGERDTFRFLCACRLLNNNWKCLWMNGVQCSPFNESFQFDYHSKCITSFYERRKKIKRNTCSAHLAYRHSAQRI